MDRLRALHESGVSIWLDTLSRDLLATGEFARLISEQSVTGATSNPTIFAAAITGSKRYEEQLSQLVEAGNRDLRELFFALALDDVRWAADLLRPVFGTTQGRDGFVSFQCTPDLADDTDATVEQARTLWSRIGRPNVLIKVPATSAGIPAIEELTAEGINVNVTLLFSLARYAQALDAYQAGLERRLSHGQSLEGIASVASFFVSRVDSSADALLPPDSALRGRVAVANAIDAFGLYQQTSTSPRWRRLAAAHARPQRPLWASTATKNPAFSDLLYVESLIAPGVVNTMARQTLDAFRDHGSVTRLAQALPDQTELWRRVTAAGIDLAALTDELERDGVHRFRNSYDQILESLDQSVGALVAS